MYEIEGGQGHADEPPDEADFQAVVGRFGVLDRQGKRGIAGRQDHGIDAEDYTGEHAEKINAGCQESVQLIFAAEFEGNAGEASDGEEREDVAERPGFEISSHLRLHAKSNRSDDCGEGEQAPPGEPRDFRRAFTERVGCLQLDPQGTVHHQRQQGEHADQDGVPVENSGLFAQPEIRPQGFKEVAAGIERNAADDIPKSRAEKNTEEQAGEGEYKIPERYPHHAPDMIAEFDGGSAEDQEPKYDQKRQVEAAKAAGVKSGESKIKSPTGSKEPDLVAIPHRADAGEDLSAFFRSTPDEQVNGAGAKIEAIEQNVDSRL